MCMQVAGVEDAAAAVAVVQLAVHLELLACSS